MCWNAVKRSIRVLLGLAGGMDIFLIVLSLAGCQHCYLTVLHWRDVHSSVIMLNSLFFVCSDLVSGLLASLSEIFTLCKLVDINGLICLLLLRSVEIVINHCLTVIVFPKEVGRALVVLGQELLRLILLRLLRLDQSMDAGLSDCHAVSAAKQVVKLRLQAELFCVGVSVKRTDLNHWVSSLQQLQVKQVLVQVVRVIVALLPVWVHALSILHTMEVDQFAVTDFLHEAVPIEVICAMKVNAWEVVKLLHVYVWFMAYHRTHVLFVLLDALYRIAGHNGQALLGVFNVLIISRCFVLS